MQTKPLIAAALTLALPFLLASVPAQTESLYQVDMILFTTTDPATRTTQHWPADPGLPEMAGASKIGEGALISPREGSLAEVWERLDTSGRYRPLAYFRWRQVAASAGRLSKAGVESSALVGKKGPPQLLGTVALSQDGAVQANVDVVYREKDSTAEASGTEVIKGYRLREQRRLLPGELHYFDHEVFGALIQITPAG